MGVFRVKGLLYGGQIIRPLSGTCVVIDGVLIVRRGRRVERGHLDTDSTPVPEPCTCIILVSWDCPLYRHTWRTQGSSAAGLCDCWVVHFNTKRGVNVLRAASKNRLGYDRVEST